MKSILSRPSSVLLLANGIALGLGVVSAAIQARILGPVGRGELAVAMVPATLLAMLLCIGLPDYMARRVAVDGDTKRASSLALALSLCVGIVFTVPYVLLAGLLAPQGSDAWWLIVTFAVLTPLFVYGYCITGVSVGNSNWKLVALSKIVPQAGAVSGLLLVATTNPSVLQIGVILIGSSLVGLIVPASLAGAVPLRRFTFTDVRQALSFGIRGWGAGALALVNQRVDLVMMTILASHAQLGYYAVSTTLAAVFGTVSTAISLPTRNRVARGDKFAAVHATGFAMAATLISGLIVIALLPLIVSVLLGNDFLPAVPVMAILIAGQVPLAGAVVLTASLVGVGKPAAPMAGEAVALIATVVCITFLFPLFGTLAAAWANVFAHVLSLLVLLWLARRHIADVPYWRYLFISPARARDMIRGRETVINVSN